MGMAKLDELLAEAEATNIKMREAAASKTEDGARGVIGLRTKFAELMAQSVAAMHADQRLKDNPGVSSKHGSSHCGRSWHTTRPNGASR